MDIPAVSIFRQLEREETRMSSLKPLAAAALLLLMHIVPACSADEKSPPGELTIDVVVPLKPSKIVFNIDHPAFVGDQSIGLNHMRFITQKYKAKQTPLQIIAVFYSMGGYMLLNDAAYNKARRAEKGNPYKEQIAALQKEGVEFEECGDTARTNGWVNSDLLPGIKVNSGGNLRLVQLVQDGFVMLHP
jgi:uncharacterized protein